MRSVTAQTHDVAGEQRQRASRAALASLLNLTLLPGFAFLWLLWNLKQCGQDGIDRYHTLLGLKLNLLAALALLVVSSLMILTGGFYSPWTWVYVITYFTLVHSLFIFVAVWVLVRAWAGQKLGGR